VKSGGKACPLVLDHNALQATQPLPELTTEGRAQGFNSADLKFTILATAHNNLEKRLQIDALGSGYILPNQKTPFPLAADQRMIRKWQ